MKVIGIKENGSYVGYTFADDVQTVIDMYNGTQTDIVILADAEDDIARNLVDYFTMAQGDPSVYQLDDNFTLTPDGEQLWALIQ